jgi:hypothetical protein
MKTLVQCPHCGTDSEVPDTGLFSCFECGRVFNVEAPAAIVARPLPPERTGRVLTDWGRQVFVVLIVLVAFPLLIFGLGGVVLAILIWVVAAIMNRRVWSCSECRSGLDRRAKTCPACRATLR